MTRWLTLLGIVIALPLLAFAEEKERSAQFDPVAFDNIPDLLELNLAAYVEQRNLDGDTYDILSSAGCF